MSELLEILVKTMDKHHAQRIQVLDFHGVSSFSFAIFYFLRKVENYQY